MQPVQPGKISEDRISQFCFQHDNIEIHVLRLDKIHPLISGNKWFKLKFYLDAAREENKDTILTFGGYWSNHILATAAFCQIEDLASIGIIRGEEILKLSTTLEKAKSLGMKLFFSDRESYRQKKMPAQIDLKNTYIINEGGFGSLGARGAATILDYCTPQKFTHICCAVGTGTMMAGLINASIQKQLIIGFSVLKNNREASKKIKTLVANNRQNFEIIHDYHFGGYAKKNEELLHFMNYFHEHHKIPTDFVYTGKLFYGVCDLIKKNYFAPGSKVLIIHSGGIQGNDSLKEGTLIF